MGQSIQAYWNPDSYPNSLEPPTFDPLYGFKNGRKERVMVATVEEMDAARVPLRHRDYCAHHYIDWRNCCNNHYILDSKCKGLKDLWDHCSFEDHILRMKEYEREKRLIQRQRRIKEREMKESMEA